MSPASAAPKASPKAPSKAAPDGATGLPKGYWGRDRVRPILDKVQSTRYEVDLTELGAGTRAAVDELVRAGRALQDLAELTEHPQALDARARLEALHERLGRPAATSDLIHLYRFSQGPIATTLDNELLPFLPVDGFAGGRNVYPWQIEAPEVEAFLDQHPEQRGDILGLHTVVRRSSPTNLRRDLTNIRGHRELAVLHPGLEARLTALAADPKPPALYAVPYSVAWPKRILAIADHLWRASELVCKEDADFAAFLNLRARDLLTDDNEAGDAAWVRGTFNELDVVVGAHEPYDDDLFGAKAFFGLSILVRDEPSTHELRDRLRYLQAIEDALPIGRHRTVATDIPVGSFNAVATFGQGRGTAAEILPNDPDLIRKYGRKIALRRNLTVHPDAFGRVAERWKVVMAPIHHGDMTPEGIFRQNTWHEVGHYLGPDTDHLGRALDVSLAEDGPPIEELKSELLALFACHWLGRIGAFTPEEVRAVVAYGLFGGFRPVRPLRSQPYPTIWLMLGNYYLEAGVLWAADDGYHLDYDRVWETTVAMLGEVLALQDRGVKADSEAYIERWTRWDERHEAIARRIRGAERYRFRYDRYAILENGDDADQAGDSASG